MIEGIKVTYSREASVRFRTGKTFKYCVAAALGLLSVIVPAASAAPFSHPRPHASSVTVNGGFVYACGAQVCLNGYPYTIRGATTYGLYQSPSQAVSLAQQANLDTLELVEFDTQYHQLSDTESAATWTRVDQYIAAASAAGLHVVLNLSEYGQSLQAAGQTPTTTDWNGYLSFIANRTNTVTGVQYKNDPAIAMVELFGEICYPVEVDATCPAGTTGTAQQMQDFFSRTLAEWHSLAPNTLISTGGFSHLDNPTSSGIPWQAIVSNPANAMCDIEINSQSDIDNAVGKFTQYCQQLGEPWFLSAWSSCYQDSGYPFYLANDAAMAAHTQEMYSIASGNFPGYGASVGTDFWNMNGSTEVPGSCDLNQSFPQTWAAVQTGGAS